MSITDCSACRLAKVKVYKYILRVSIFGSRYNVRWNNVYRRIFGMNVWESVKLVQLFSGRLDLIHIVDKLKLKVKLFW